MSRRNRYSSYRHEMEVGQRGQYCSRPPCSSHLCLVSPYSSNVFYVPDQASGFYLAFGVFHEYYTIQAQYEHGSESAWIGVLSSGLPFLGAPALVWLCTHKQLARIHYVWVGFVTCVCSLIGAAFSQSMPALIVTQGLMFGVGILLMDNPIMIMINTWFVRRRGIAYGILFGVCDLFGLGWSFLANYLLLHLGLRKTMLIFAAIVFVVSGPCLFFLRERGAKSIFSPGLETPTPQTPRRGSGTPKTYEKYAVITKYSKQRFYHCWLFYVLAICNLAHGCAYYLPFSKSKAHFGCLEASQIPGQSAENSANVISPLSIRRLMFNRLPTVLHHRNGSLVGSGCYGTCSRQFCTDLGRGRVRSAI